MKQTKQRSTSSFFYVKNRGPTASYITTGGWAREEEEEEEEEGAREEEEEEDEFKAVAMNEGVSQEDVCVFVATKQSRVSGLGFGVWGLGFRVEVTLNPKHFCYYYRTREGGGVKEGGQADAWWIQR
jgi:hypothetical protein